MSKNRRNSLVIFTLFSIIALTATFTLADIRQNTAAAISSVSEFFGISTATAPQQTVLPQEARLETQQASIEMQPMMFFTNVTYYYKGTGALNTATNWNTARDGSGTNAANFTSADVFVIQNGQSPTLGGAWTISGANSGLLIETGGAMNTGANSPTLTLSLQSGATYTVANSSWANLTFGTVNANSNFVVTGNATTLIDRAYGNFTWQSSGGTVTPGNDLNVAGTLTIASGSELRVSTGSTARTWNVGAIQVNSGSTLNLGNSSANGTVVNLTGSLTNNGTINKSTTGLSTVNFSGTGASTVNWGTVTNTNFSSVSFVVASGRTVTFNDSVNTGAAAYTVNGTLNLGTTAISGTSGTFSLAATGTLGLGSPDGINSGTSLGNLRVSGGRSFSSGATFVYNGTAAQVTGNGLPLLVTNLTIDNSLGVTLSQDAGVTGTLTLTNGTVTTGALLKVNLQTGANLTRTNGYVIGSLRQTYSSTGNKNFPVGTANGYSPVGVNATSVIGAPVTFTVAANQGAMPALTGSGEKLARSWTLSGGLGITADLTFSYPSTDAGGNVANYKFFKNTGGSLSILNPSATTPDIGADEIIAVAVPGSLQFSSATYSVGEAGPTATITVTRTGGSDGLVGVSYATAAGGTATGGAACGGAVDYQNTSGTLSWANGDTASKTFTIGICDDATVEGNETVNLALSSPTGGATLGSPNTAVMTIIDNDVAAGSFSINDVRVTEGNAGPVTATFTVSYTAGGAANVSFATANVTATSGTDYATNSGTLNFGASGSTQTQTVNVTVNGDTSKEANEVFVVNLSGATGGATITDNQGAGIIVDDDRPYVADFDGDRKADYSVYRPGTLLWYALQSGSGTPKISGAGPTGGVAVTGDYDGDGKADFATFQASSGVWSILRSSTNALQLSFWGGAGDKPVQGDYDGDGKTDLAIYRPSAGQWWILRSSDNSSYVVTFGISTDRLVQGDYDGDAKTDQAVYRDGIWFVLRSSNGAVQIQNWGNAADKPVSGDFDGDGRYDFAIYRAGTWWVINSLSGASSVIPFGLATDLPAPADFDGDGSTDMTVFRPSSGDWFVLRSSNLTLTGVNWGINGDVPAPSAYIPQ